MGAWGNQLFHPIYSTLAGKKVTFYLISIHEGTYTLILYEVERSIQIINLEETLPYLEKIIKRLRLTNLARFFANNRFWSNF